MRGNKKFVDFYHNFILDRCLPILSTLLYASGLIASFDIISLGLIFLILGLRIFFLKILRSEEGKKIKIKITKKIFFYLI